MTSHSVFLSVADRDAMVEAGMGVGVEEGYSRLDELADPPGRRRGALISTRPGSHTFAISAPRPTLVGRGAPFGRISRRGP